MMPNPLRLCSVFALGSACLLGQSFSHGTAIALVRTDEVIVIAADVRAVDGATGQKRPDECKIRTAGNYFFSVHGVADSDILGIVKTILIAPDSLSTKAQAVRERLAPTVTKRMQTQPRDGQVSSGVFMFGAEGGVLRLAYVKFAISGTTIAECPGVDCRPTGIAMASVSPYGNTLPVDARTLEDVRNFVLGQISKGLVLEERDGNTAAVGAPIQSLILYRNGKHNWHDKPEVCKDQR
jgi:hypothetical protein